MMRTAALILMMAATASAEILTLADGEGNVAQIDADTSQFRWERLRLVMPGRGTHPDDFEQYGEIRDVGVVTDGSGLFHTTYTTHQYNGYWREAVPYTLSTNWVDIRSSGLTVFETEDVTPSELTTDSLEYQVRTTQQESFPEDPGDGRIAQNIIGEPREYLTHWESRPDTFHTMRAAWFTLTTDDAITWQIAGQQNWQAGLENDIRADLLPSTFTVLTGNDPLPGDVNLDGEVNGLDVDPFVDQVTAGTYQDEADMNKDGAVNGLDVDRFVQAVVGAGSTLRQVPEPSTSAMLVVAALGLLLSTARNKPDRLSTPVFGGRGRPSHLFESSLVTRP